MTLMSVKFLSHIFRTSATPQLRNVTLASASFPAYQYFAKGCKKVNLRSMTVRIIRCSSAVFLQLLRRLGLCCKRKRNSYLLSRMSKLIEMPGHPVEILYERTRTESITLNRQGYITRYFHNVAAECGSETHQKSRSCAVFALDNPGHNRE